MDLETPQQALVQDNAPPDTIEDDFDGKIIEVSFPPATSTSQLADQLGAIGKIIRGPMMRGENAWNTMGKFQDVLAENEFTLSGDSGYILGGFHSYAHFRKTANRHALIEAKKHIDNAVARNGFQAHAKNTADHPCHHLELAYAWIQRTSLPLFADSTFKPLGCTWDEFFTVFRNAHVDCARQKILLAAQIVEKGRSEDDELGFALIEQVIRKHLPRLGILDTDPALEKYLDVTRKDISLIYSHFCRRRFQDAMHEILPPKLDLPGVITLDQARQALTQVREQKKSHTATPDTAEYQLAIIDAMGFIQRAPRIAKDKTTYEGTGFNQGSFETEFQRCIEAMAARHIEAVQSPESTGETCKDALDHFEKTREMFGHIDMPEDVEVGYAMDDWWLASVFRKYGYRSYTNFQDEMQIAGAHGVINNAIDSDGAYMAHVYDDLDKGEAMLEDARFPTDHPALLAAVRIDHAMFSTALNKTAPYAGNANWDAMHHIGNSTGKKLEFADNVQRVRQRIAGIEDEYILNFRDAEFIERENALILRHAEEMLADSCICLSDGATGAGRILSPAFAALDDIEADILSREVYQPMGMSAPQAGLLETRFSVMEILKHWKDGLNESASLRERLDSVLNVASILKTFEPDMRAHFDRVANVDVSNRYPLLLREIALPLYREAMTEFDYYRDDPIKAFDSLKTARKALEAINPVALEKNIVALRPEHGPVDDGFLKKYARYEGLAKSWVDPRADFKKSCGRDSIARMKQALRPENRGAQAFQMITGLARKLREEGRSILDPEILAAAKMSPRTLRKFLDEQALTAAMVQVKAARENGPVTVSLYNIDEHQYTRYRAALGWVTRTTFTPLSDKPYRVLGFASRADFTSELRKSLIDLANQLERGLTSHGLQKGPLQFLGVLRELQVGYELLGKDAEMAEGRERVRRAIRSMGPTIYKDVLASGKRDGEKFKVIAEVISLATIMNAADWTITDEEKHEAIIPFSQKMDVYGQNLAFNHVVHRRVVHAVDRYFEHPRSPVTGIYLALIIDDWRKAYQLDDQPWFKTLFQEHNCYDFNSFANMTCAARIRQLVLRTNNMFEKLDARDKKSMVNPRMHLNILRDLERIDNLVQSGLISPREKIEILNSYEVPENWMRLKRRTSAACAMPLLLKHAKDPALKSDERLMALKDCYDYAKITGKPMLEDLQIDWSELDKLRSRAARHMAARYVAEELPRGTPKTIRTNIIKAQQVLATSGQTMCDFRTLRAMGFTADELPHVAPLADLINVFDAQHMVFALNGEVDPLHLMPVVIDYANAVVAEDTDVFAKQSLTCLGFTGIADYKTRMDPIIFEALKLLHSQANEARAAIQPEQVKNLLETTQYLMDGLRICERHDDAALSAAGLLTMKEIEGAMRAVTKPADAPKAPAPV